MSGCVCHRYFIEGCPLCHQRAGIALPTREQTEASIATANSVDSKGTQTEIKLVSELGKGRALLAESRALLADMRNSGDETIAMRDRDTARAEASHFLAECTKRNHTINALNETIGDRDAKILTAQREISRLKAGLVEMRARFIGPGLLNALVVHDIDVLLGNLGKEIA